MGTLIKPGEAPIPFNPPEGRVMFTLEQLQTAVGGYIEAVPAPFRILDTDEPTWIVVNEDGQRENLPVNGFATALYHQAGGPPEWPILGTVVLATQRELNGDDDTDEGP